MCGIAGYAILYKEVNAKVGKAHDVFHSYFDRVLRVTAERGQSMMGAAFIRDYSLSEDSTDIAVGAFHASSGKDGAVITTAPNYEVDLIGLRWETPEAPRVMMSQGIKAGENYAAIVNFRGVPTTETSLTGKAAVQPFVVTDSKDVTHETWVTHNGLLSNDRELYAKFGWPTVEPGVPDIDSYAFGHLLNYAVHDKTMSRFAVNYRVGQALAVVKGSYALGAIARNQDIILARTYLGMHLAVVETFGVRYLVWASEAAALRVDPDNADFDNRAYREFPTDHFLVFTPGFSRDAFLAGSSCDQVISAVVRQAKPIRPLMFSNGKVAVVISGGLDSTVVATLAAKQYEEVHFLHFAYGARAESQEWNAVKNIAAHLEQQFGKRVILNLIDLSFLKSLGGSTLTDHSLEVAKGEVGVETAHEWVPARNMVMMSMAAAYCDRHSVGTIALGLNMEEGGVYQDNSIEFFEAFEAAAKFGAKSAPKMFMPLARKMKHEIVKLGYEIDAPIHLSWSCYHGGELPCGTCGPDIMRKKAHEMNGLVDTLSYQE
jgi:queuosine biosynthesis protein QueC